MADAHPTISWGSDEATVPSPKDTAEDVVSRPSLDAAPATDAQTLPTIGSVATSAATHSVGLAQNLRSGGTGTLAGALGQRLLAATAAGNLPSESPLGVAAATALPLVPGTPGLVGDVGPIGGVAGLAQRLVTDSSVLTSGLPSALGGLSLPVGLPAVGMPRAPSVLVLRVAAPGSDAGQSGLLPSGLVGANSRIAPAPASETSQAPTPSTDDVVPVMTPSVATGPSPAAPTRQTAQATATATASFRDVSSGASSGSIGGPLPGDPDGPAPSPDPAPRAAGSSSLGQSGSSSLLFGRAEGSCRLDSLAWSRLPDGRDGSGAAGLLCGLDRPG